MRTQGGGQKTVKFFGRPLISYVLYLIIVEAWDET